MSARPLEFRAFTLGLGVLLLAATAAGATSQGPEPMMTGVPANERFAGEQTCVLCHSTYPLNPDDRGHIAVQGLPPFYVPGERYSLTFTVSHPDPDRRRWGFQLTAVNATTLEGAGSIVVTDARNTQLLGIEVGGRQYIMHTYTGTAIGKVGSRSWRFDWIAPARDEGPVAFYAAGSAANMDGAKEGDYIFNPTPDPVATVPGPGAPASLQEELYGSG